MKVINHEILRPKINNIESIENDTLYQRIKNDPTTNSAIQCLTELLQRQEKQMQELKEEITKANQEIKKLDSKVTPFKKKCGRKQKKYYYDTGLVDDAELLRLIDGEFITISKLEKEVGAKKNVLRRRYERLKAKENNSNP